MTPVPIPPKLAKLANAATRPLHIGSAEVEPLLEFWGLTANGHGLLNKLVNCGTLIPVPQSITRCRRFETNAVLALYHQLLTPAA